jgi:hypothetical protein
MDRRRVLLLAALVLGTSALIASLSAPRDRGSGGEPPAGAPTTTAPSARPTPEARLDAARPGVVTVARGSHVVLQVEVPEPGEVAIPRLGLTASGQPGTPARFDILAERTGRYGVEFVPTGAASRRAGTLVVQR